MEEAIKGTQFWTMTCRGIEEQYEADAAEATEAANAAKKLKGLCDALMTDNHLVYHREDPIIEEVRTVTGGSSPPPCPPTLTPCPQCILSALTLC